MLNKTKMPLRRLIALIASFVVVVGTAIAIPFIVSTAEKTPEQISDATNVITTTYDLSRKVPENWLRFKKEEVNGKKVATFVGFNIDVKDSNNLSISDWSVQSQGYWYNLALSGAKGLTISGVQNVSGYPTLEIPAVTSDGYTVTTIAKITDIGNSNDGNAGKGYKEFVPFITAVVIPGTVTSIADNAFACFYSLEYLKVPFLGTSTKASKPLAAMVSTPDVDNSAVYFVDALASLTPKKENGDLDYGVSTDMLSAPGYESIERPCLKTVEYEWYSGVNITNYTGHAWYYVPPRLAHVEVEATLPVGKVDDEYYLDYNFVDRAFFNFPYLNTVKITDDIYSLDAYNLFAESGVVDVKLPEEVSSIGKGIFNYCDELKTITLPNNLQDISEAAFYGCTNLETINIPATVKTFDSSCFQDCPKLKDMNIYTGRDTNGELKFVAAKTGGFNIPLATTKIGASAFANCKLFTLVNLSSGYDSNDPKKEATANLTSIGEGAFRGCTNISTLIVPFVGSKVGNSGTKEAVIGYLFGSTSIEGTTMASQQYGSTSAADSYQAAIPDSLTTIVVTGETLVNRGAFQGLQNLQTLTLTASVRNISTGILADCPNFKKLVIPFVGSTVDNQTNACWLFRYNTQSLPTGSPYYKVGEYDVPKTLNSIEITKTNTVATGLFFNLSSLQEVIIDYTGENQTFNGEIFRNNGSLKRLVVPFVGWHNYIWYPTWPASGWSWWSEDKNVRNSLCWLFSTTPSSAPEYANVNFCAGNEYHREIRTHYIPNALEEVEITNAKILGVWALRGFSKVKRIIVSNSPSCIQYQAFGGCNSLEELEVPYLGYDGNAKGLNGVEYSLGHYFGKVTGNSYVAMHDYRIPYSLTTVRVRDNTLKISDYAFYGCSSLTSIELTGRVGELGYACFYGCVTLGHLTTPNAYYTEVPDYAFYNCQTLDSLYIDDRNYFIPNTVEVIGNYAFANTSIGTIDFTKYRKIGNYAFQNCLQLTSVNVTPNVKAIGTAAFSGCSNIKTAQLSQNLVAPYLFSNCTSLTSINLEGVTTNIPDGLFYNCTSLTSEGLTMPQGNKTIGASAFFNCKSLTSFILGPSTTTIGKAAFQNCKGLSMLRIPNSVVDIAEAGWYGCNDNFYFTVLQQEDDWPEGWTEGWPCDFPVIIEGDVDDTVFTYVYDSKVKGYLITGVTAGGDTLAGTIQLPTNHNGISVKGVIGRAFENQPQVLAFIVPSTYVVLSRNYTADNQQYTGMPFTTGKQVVVYMMDTLDRAIAKGFHNLADTTVALDDVNTGIRKENDFSDNAVFYYGDYWELKSGNKTSSGVPTLLADKLEYITDTENFVYDGVTNHQRVILSITTMGFPVGSAEQVVLYSKEAGDASELQDEIYNSVSRVFEKNSELTIFDSLYSNNLVASEEGASLVLTPNEGKIKRYNQDYTYSKGKNYAPIYITGKKVIRYGVSKRLFTVFWTGNEEQKYTLQNHSYDGNPYSISFNKNNTLNDTTYVYGLGTRFYLTGTLATFDLVNNKYTGDVKYNRVLDSQNNWVYEVAPYIASGDDGEVRWREKWNVYDVNGRNVTTNFEIFVNYCEFTITPRKVKVVWESSNYTNEIYGITYPLFQYTGSIIYPYAKAVEIDDENKSWGDTRTGLLELTYFKSDLSVIEIKPTYNKNTGAQINAPNTIFAVLDPEQAGNYEIVTINKNGQAIKAWLDPAVTGQAITNGVSLDYHICKASVEVALTNDNYTMGANETYWSINDFTKNNKATVRITGLGSGSIIEGEFRTIAEGDTYQPTTYTTAGQMFKWADLNNNGLEDDVHIYRMKEGVRLDEDDCYDIPFDITASIAVFKNRFNVNFYIDYDENGTNTPINLTEKVIGGNRVNAYTYVTVGGDHVLSALATNANLSEEGVYYSTLTRMYGYHVDGEMKINQVNPMTFNKAASGDGEIYEFYVKYTRKNYEDYDLTLYLFCKKSTVTFASFDKEYDSKPIDPYSNITKIAKDYPYEINVDNTGKAIDQYNQLTFDFYYREAFNIADLAALPKLASMTNAGQTLTGTLPYEVSERAAGKGYVVVINCPETDYFDGLTNKVIEFEISRRSIYIDLAEQGASKNWDGLEYAFTPNSTIYTTNRGVDTAGNPVGDLLLGHSLTGTLHTRSGEPKTYSQTSDWYWDPMWGVSNTYNEDVSSCYKIVFKNSFTINARTLTLSVNNVNAEFGYDDQELFTFTVTAVDSETGEAPVGGYTVYYVINYSFADADELGRWRTTPYSYSRPDKYYINYKVVAPHYETQYGTGYINIWRGYITYTMAAYTGQSKMTYKYLPATEDKYATIQIDYDGVGHQVGIDEKHPWYAYARYWWRRVGESNWHYSEYAPTFTNLGFYELKVRVRAKSETYYVYNHEEDYYVVEVRIPGYGDGGDKSPIVITDQFESSVISSTSPSMANYSVVSTPHNIHQIGETGSIYYAIKLSITNRFAIELRDNRCYTTNNGQVVPNVRYEYSTNGIDWQTNYIGFNMAGSYKVYYRIYTYDVYNNEYRSWGFVDLDDDDSILTEDEAKLLKYVTLKIKTPDTWIGPDPSDCFIVNIYKKDINGVETLITDPSTIVYDGQTSYAVRVSIKDSSYDTEELSFESARQSHTIHYKKEIGDTWQTNEIWLTEPGTYHIYYKVIAAGFSPVGIDNESYMTLTIPKEEMPGGPAGPEGEPYPPENPDEPTALINAYSYTGVYDKLDHGVLVYIDRVGLKTLLVEESAISENEELEINVYYSIDARSKEYDDGWSQTPITRRDVGTTLVYIKVEVNNFKPVYFTRSINISQVQMILSSPSAGLEVEYSGRKTVAISNSEINLIECPVLYYDWNLKAYRVIDETNYDTVLDSEKNPYTSYEDFYLNSKAEDKIISEIDVEDRDVDEYIKLDSIYDGTPQYTYYSTKLIDGELQKNKLVSPILPGKYIAVITYPSTTNCKGDTIERLLTVTPKTLHLTWNDKIPYDGEAHRPQVSITAKDLASIDDSISIRVYNLIDGEKVQGIEHTEIGDYEYTVEIFEDGMDTYYRLESDTIVMSITKRDIAIVVNVSVPYIKNHPWFSTDEENGIDLNTCIVENQEKGFVSLLAGHKFVGTIRTDSYARGTYLMYYGVDPTTNEVIYWGDENTAAHANKDNRFVRWEKMDNGKSFDIVMIDENQNEVSVAQYYTLRFDFRVKIHYPDMDINIQPKTIVYDGLPHSLDLDMNNLPVGEGVSPSKYRAAVVEYSKDGLEWFTKAAFEGYVDACLDPNDPYDIYVRLTHPDYEEYYLKTTLTILKAQLDVEITPLEVTYDAEVHNVEYEVVNAEMHDDPTAVLYYLTSEYSGEKLLDDILTNGSNGKYYSLGIQNPTEAGEYYAVVYYKAGRNWYASGDISILKINKRKVNITIPKDIYAVKNYDGEKYSVSLRGATIDQTMLVDYGGSAYGHYVYNSSANYLTIRTNSANVKYKANDTTFSEANIIEYKGSLGDFEFDPEASLILDMNLNNVSANYQPIIVGGNDITVLINKISLEFTVEDLEREYDSYYDETLKKYVPLPAIPNIITPDKVNPNIYFDNEPIYVYYYAEKDSNGNKQPTTETLNGAAPTNVGLYYVVVGYKPGTNYHGVNVNTSHSGFVTITPKVVSIDWDELEKVFDATYQTPVATYEDALHEVKNATVYFYENDAEVSGVINAGEYVAYAKATTDANHIVDETTSTAIFKIGKISYTIKFKDSTISLEGYNKYFTETDVPGIIPGLVIKGKGGGEDTKGVVHQLVNANGEYVAGTYYSGDFEVLYSVYKDDINVTKSIDILVDCIVVVETREIQFTTDDVKLAYNEQGYTIYEAGALNITYPNVKDLTVLFKEVGEADAYETIKKYYDCGTYEIEFTITGRGYSTQTGSVIITIEPATPSFEFMTSLSREYNGLPIDDTILVTRGNYNRSPDVGATDKSDLIYTYYRADEFGNIIDSDGPICVKTSNETTGTLPVDAGYYALVVTSAADTKDIDYNYKTLEAKLSFQIKPKTLRLIMNYDREVASVTDLNATWIESGSNIMSEGPHSNGALRVKGLGNSQDSFNFTIWMDGTQSGTSQTKMYRGKYEFNETFIYGVKDASENSASSADLEYMFGYDTVLGNSNEAKKQTFILKYDLTNSSRTPGTVLDTTPNYTIQLEFKLYIHYPDVDYDLDLDDTAYNGQAHYSYVIINSKSSGSIPVEVEVQYAAEESDLYNGHFITTTNKTANIENRDSTLKLYQVGQTDPGVQPVYIHIIVTEEGKYFEDVYDKIFIKVDPVKRNVTNYISEHFSKEYDLAPVGQYDAVTKSYLPILGQDYVINYTNSEQQSKDNYNPKDLFIEFVDYNTNVTIDSAIDAGEYTYRFVIPESESGFFARTVIIGRFTITKQNLYLINTDSEGYVSKEYNGSSATYSVATESHHMVVDKEGNEVSFNVSGVLITADRAIGIYNGSNIGNMDWVSNYTIMADTTDGYSNVTANYQLSFGGLASNSEINEFKIKIVPGKMRLNVPQGGKVEFTYDGSNHMVPYKTYVERPTSGVIATYSLQDTDDKNVLDKTRFTSTYPDLTDVKIEYNEARTAYEVVPYSLWLKLEVAGDTYEPEYVHLNVYVKQATPKLTILRPTEYQYTGLSVTEIDPNVDISNTADKSFSNEYDVNWIQLVDNNGVEEEINMSGVIPKEVGKYKIVVYWTPTQSTRYTGAEVSHTFTIGARHIAYSWNQTAFVYNGESQHPVLDLENTGLPAQDIGQLDVNYEWQPVGNTGDIDSIKVGRYQIKATLVPKSTDSSFKSSNYVIDGEETISYNIASRRIVIKANTQVVYTGEPIALNYDPNSGDAYRLDLTKGFDFAEGEYTDSVLLTTTAEPHPELHAYKAQGDSLGEYFMWQGSSFDIYDENGTLVTSNYSVTYDVSVRILLENMACKLLYDGSDTTSETFEYDGKPHTLQVVPKNQGTYNVYYTVQVGSETITSKNTPIELTDADFYEISYKIYRIDEDLQESFAFEDSAPLNINPKQTQIVLKNADDLSKIYDGKDVVNPDVELVGLENVPIDLKWFYINVDNNKVTDKVRAVGSYMLVVEKDDENGNYDVTRLEQPFEITQREIVVSYPETSMTYSGTYWSVELDTAHDTNKVYVIRMNNDKTKDGLAEGHTLTALIRTAYVSARALPYRSLDEFVIVRNRINDENGTDVTQNYSLLYDLDVKISKAEIELESEELDVEVDFDGKPHSIQVDVKTPADGYTITYSKMDEEFTTVNPEFTTRCFVTVNFRVEAENYEPYEGSATIKINGVKNPSKSEGGTGPDTPGEEDVAIDSHIQFDNPYIYDGNPYPTPIYVVDESNGSGYDASGQVVYYFPIDYEFTRDQEGYVVLTAEELANETYKQAPVNVGRYKFVIYIPANGNYDPFNTNAQTFRIERRKIEVTWHNLELEYNYNEQAPYATYTTVGGQEVRVDIIDVGLRDVGEYDVSLGTEYAGYELYEITNLQQTFTITKRAIEDFIIMTGMEFEYSPEGKEIVKIRNKDEVLVTIDEDGYVRKVGSDDWTVEDYIIIVSKDRNADRVNSGEHTITVRLVDPANTKWASKGNTDNASDDLVTTFSITPYTFYGIQHSTDTKLWYSWDKFVVINTKPNNQADFSLEVRTNGDNEFYTFIKPAAPESEVTSTDDLADYVYMYRKNAKLSAEYGENAYIMITGINNFDFKLKLEYEITAAKPKMFELVADSTAKFVYVEYLDGALNYYKNDFSDEDPNSEVIYIKETKDEEGNVISTEEIRRVDNAQDNIFIGHIYQSTSIFEVLSQIKNDIACMRVYSYNVEAQEDELGNTIYKNVYTMIDPNLIDDDDDPYDNYKTTFFGTGMRIVLYEDDTCKKEVDYISGIVLGDLNGDGKVNNSDGQILQSFLMNEIDALSLGYCFYAALVSEKDGEKQFVNNSDGQVLQAYLMNEDDSDYNSKYIVDTGGQV